LVTTGILPIHYNKANWLLFSFPLTNPNVINKFCAELLNYNVPQDTGSDCPAVFLFSDEKFCSVYSSKIDVMEFACLAPKPLDKSAGVSNYHSPHKK
jgi:hypothetical protein